MDRREFLGVASLGTGAAAAAAAGCSQLGPPALSLPLSEGQLEARLDRLDRGLADIRGATIFDGMQLPEGALDARPEARRYAESSQEHVSRSFRALLTTGAVLDLPVETRRHPEVRRRIDAQSAELDQAIVDSAGFLAALPEGAVADIERMARSDPDLVMGLHESLDQQAARYGLANASRGQLRRAGANTAFRLKKQPASLLIGEYVSKVERIAARRGADVAGERGLATAAIEQLIWTPSAGGGGVRPALTGSRRSARGRSRGVVHAAEWTAGIGAAMLGIGVIAWAIGASTGGAGAVTFGVLLIAAGLVAILVGGLIALGGAASGSRR